MYVHNEIFLPSQNGSGELLYYKRSDTLGPKLCDYAKTALDADACVGITNILIASNGCIGIVKKTRQLYMIGQTRVHVDNVEGLGNYLELEVCNCPKIVSLYTLHNSVFP